LFEQQADKLATAAGLLDELLQGGARTRQCCERLGRMDSDATQSAGKGLSAV
jgi:hypothetical protein